MLIFKYYRTRGRLLFKGDEICGGVWNKHKSQSLLGQQGTKRDERSSDKYLNYQHVPIIG